MEGTFNAHQKYLNEIVFSVFKKILLYPKYNNYGKFYEIMDKIFKKTITNNDINSNKISSDCKLVIDLIVDYDYIYLILDTYENESDAYHYLALVAQMKRIGNKYKIFNSTDDNYCNIEGIIEGFCDL